MQITCMCCREEIGEKPGDGETSGICDDCLFEHYPDVAERVIAERMQAAA